MHKNYDPWLLSVLIILLSISSFYLFTLNNDFPFGFHPDEIKKVKFVLGQRVPDFKHPLLIIQTCKVINYWTGYLEYQDTVVMARTTTAFYGVVLVIVTFLITYQICSSTWIAFFSAVLVITNPIIITHTHYLKEDIALSAMTMLSIYCLIRFTKSLSLVNTIGLGISLGLMFSSHYKAALFFVPLTIVLIYFLSKLHWRLWAYKTITVSLITIITFLIINYPLIIDFSRFMSGVLFELRHASKGHSLFLPFSIAPFFHFRNSLFEYTLLTVPFSIALFVSIYHGMVKKDLRLIVLFSLAAINYLIIELSPLKTSPGYVRYVIPLIPILTIISCSMINVMGVKLKTMAIILITVLAVKDFHYGFSVVDLLDQDNRILIHEKKLPKEVTLFEKYSTGYLNRNSFRTAPSIVSPGPEVLKRNGIQYLVASSFRYDRFLTGKTLQRQRAKVYEIGNAYDSLFTAYDTETLRPVVKTIGFFHPELKIVNLENKK